MKLVPMFVQPMGRFVQSNSFNPNKRLERSYVAMENFPRIANKGINKITELRTILQRESQNS
jgi:hypothetical protein